MPNDGSWNRDLGLGLESFDTLLTVIHDDHTHQNTLSIDVNAACASMKHTDVLDSSPADTSYLSNLLVLVSTDNSKP